MNRGLIIGGPMDGKLLEYKGEVFDYHKTPESLSGPIDYSDLTATQAAMRATSERGRYYFTDMTILGSTGHSTGRRIGFWVEHDKTLDDALEALLTRYQEPRRHLSLLRRAFRVMEQLWRAALNAHPELHTETREIMNEMHKEISHED